jgi:hypothetical protein
VDELAGDELVVCVDVAVEPDRFPLPYTLLETIGVVPAMLDAGAGAMDRNEFTVAAKEKELTV